MVGRLVQLMQYAHLPASQCCRREYGVAEVVLCHYLRTRERKEYSAWGNNLHCLLVQAGIALQRIVQRPPVLGKGRRVEHNEVVRNVISRHIIHIFESILAKSLVALVAWEVQLHVAVGQFNGLGAGVDRVYQFGPASHGIEREAARIAEHIEHAAATGILLQQQAVFALVDEEARLLATQPVDIELQSVLQSHVVVAAAIEETILKFHIGQRGLAFVVDMLQPLSHHLHQLDGYLLATQVHTNAVGLHHGRLSVHVDDESGQVVALAVNQAVGVVRGRVGQPDGLAHAECRP